jgi:hypothetical protein
MTEPHSESEDSFSPGCFSVSEHVRLLNCMKARLEDKGKEA